MGYTTDFYGEFELDKPLTDEQRAYLLFFNKTRRVVRNAAVTATRPDPVREAVGLPIGEQGEYFVGETGMMGQDEGDDVLNSNRPPGSQPGLWCGWVPDDAGRCIEWDGVEKFYNYVSWLEYLIAKFIVPWGYELNGEVEWVGEDRSDQGRISVKDNAVTVQRARVVYE